MNVLRPSRVRFVLALLLPVLALLTAAPAAAQDDFYTVPQCRMYDSRGGGGGSLVQGTPYTATLTGAPCGIPANATSVMLHATIISPGSGYLAIFPGTTLPPGTPPLNALAFNFGRTQAKNFLVSVGPGGQVSFQATITPTNPGIYHFVIEVIGYFVTAPPEAVDDSYAAEKDTTLNVPAGNGVTSNDTLLSGATIASYGASTGAEQTTLGAATPTSAGGSVVLNANGSFSYTPPAGAVGTDDTFKYVLQNAGGTDTATVTIGVGKASQTISFTSTAPSDAKVGGTTYTVTATATSGLPVAFTIDGSAGTVCSISGSTVSFIGAGTCVVNANQAGDTNYNAAPQVQQSFAVGKGDQTISFTSTAPSDAKVGGTAYNVTGTATSGLPVVFTIDAPAASVCSISGSTVTFIGVGNCVVNANQAGNGNYNAAPQVQQSFAVGKGAQTITFTSTAPSNATVNGPTYNVTATASSGLPVTFTIDASATSVCSISGSTVSFTAAGTCVINANQAGNANYDPAPQAQQSFTVGLAPQTISFTSTSPAAATVGGPTYNVTATATSGLTVTFSIDASATSVCSVAGSTVSFIGVGTCVINADQAGDASYAAAPQVQQSFGVAKGDQTITFTSTAPANAKVGGATYNVAATASSGLPVALTIDASASTICSISGSTVSFIGAGGAGTCVINANQAGNTNYNAAPQVQQSFLVAKGDQTITFTSTAPVNAKVGGPTYNVTATASSGLPVTLTIDASASSVCSISGSTVSFIGAGTCVINANQAGDTNYNAAPQVQQSFLVAKGDQTISFTSTAPANAKVGGPAYNVTANATSGLTVALTIDASAASVCSISGSTVSFIGAGTCLINANQAGNADYNAASQVQQSFVVAKGDQTITFTSTAPADAKVGGPTYNVTATASSGLPVTLTIAASSSTVCSISGSTISFIGSGTCTINANQAGNANYNAAPQVQQSFQVYQSPQITSANSVSFTSTVPGTFTVTTTGFPTGASMVITATGALPSGVTFTNNNNGTATLAGTPAAGTQGTYNLTINANNGIAPAASQSFTLTILNNVPQLTTNPVLYTTPGNTQLHVAGATLPGVTAKTDATGLLSKSGATDPDGPQALKVVPATGTTANGGSYSISDTGTFTYVPAAGFSGTDSFSYQVTDSLDAATGQVSITVGTRVWYIRDVVDANNAAGGDGRSTNAFESIAAFNAATTFDNDIIFVFEGNTGTTPHTGSITLKNGQKLHGEPTGLTVPGHGTLITAAGNRPRIRTTTASTDVVSVPATAGSRSNVEIRGVDLEATGATSNAIDVTASGGNAVGITISNNNVRGATAEGIDLNSGATATFTVTLQDNTIVSANNGIDTRVSSTGIATVTASNTMITSTAGNAFDARTLAGASALRVGLDNANVAAAGTGIFIDGSAAGTTTITSFGGNAVSGDSAGTGISVTSAIFDGVAGAPFNTIAAGSTTIGADTNSVGGPGMVLTNVQGDLSFTNLNIFAGGAGLRASSPTAYTGSAGLRMFLSAGLNMVEATGGPAVDISQASLNLPFSSIKSTNSPTTGLALNSVTGSFSAGSGSAITNITTAAGTAFQVGSSNATVTYDGSISTTQGAGVSLTSNTGSTISLSGVLTLSTGTNPAFVATGGGTVTATNTGNTLTTTTATALNVANTTIGANGLRFQRISANGATSGIVLNNTGTSGNLIVSGTAAADSGGTIQNTTSHGVSLTSTLNPSFNRMRIQNTAGSGIKGTQVAGFTFTNGTIDNSGTGLGAGESNIAFNAATVGTESNVSGTVTITGNTLTNAYYHGVDVQNFSGTLADISVSNNTVTSSSSAASSNGSGIRLIANGSASTAAVVTKATISNNIISNFPSGSGIRVQGGNGNAAGPSTTLGTPGNAASLIAITNNRVAGASAASKIGLEGILATVSGKGQGNFDVSSNGTVANPIADVTGTAISINALGAATVTATASNNVISPNNTFAAAGIAAGVNNVFGITDAPDLTVTITNNTISAVDGNGILAVARNSNGTLRAKIQNNTVSAPLTGVRPGIRVDSGTASGNTTVCLNISGNTSAGSGGSQGLGLRKQGTVPATNTFGVNGMAATSSPGVEAYVDGLNPAGSGTLLISGTSGFVNCSFP